MDQTTNEYKDKSLAGSVLSAGLSVNTIIHFPFNFLYSLYFRLENQLSEAKKDYDTKQQQLNCAYQELNKRITEHDKCALTGNKTDITLKVNC